MKLEVASEGRGLPMVEGVEGGADSPTAQRLLHPEVIHHTPLHLLLCGCKQETSEHSQLKERKERRKTEMERERG